MWRKRLIVWIAAILASLGFLNLAFTTSQGNIEIPSETQSQIFASTIQIYVYILKHTDGDQHGCITPAQFQELVKGGSGYGIARSLGTVVAIKGTRYLVTHNHWEDFFHSADLIELYDYRGKLLMRLPGIAIKLLHRYNDAGTLVLKAPPGLDIFPATLGDIRRVKPGDLVYIAHSDLDAASKVEIIPAKIDEKVIFLGNDSWSLEILSSSIEPGDSGGGIWANGQLVGNTWATGTTVNWQFWTWTSLESVKTSSHTAYAACFPADLPASLIEVGSEGTIDGLLNSRHGMIDQAP